MVGIASQNENSAAERRSAPSSMAPTMVAPARDTPGIIETHCARPMMKYIGSVKFRARRDSAASDRMRSTHSSTAPPTISVKQTIQTLNSTHLMKSCAIAPTTAAGRKASRMPITKRRAAGSLNMPIASCHKRDEIDRQQRQNRAELDQHRESLAEILIVEAEEALHQQQVAGGGDRKEFGQALDNAEDECLEKVEGHDDAPRANGRGRTRPNRIELCPTNPWGQW